MKNLIFSLIGISIFSIASAQDCYLTADMMMDGSVFRKSAKVIYEEGGDELRIETIRLGDDYSLKVVYLQSTHEGVAVNMVVNGYQHPIELELYGGAIMKFQPQKDEIVRSVAGRDEITYENTYQLTKDQMKNMALMPVTKVTIRCFGTELKRGVENDDIELAIARDRADKFSKDMGCIVRDEPKPSGVVPTNLNQPEAEKVSHEIKTRKESVTEKETPKKSSLSTTDSLLVQILRRMDETKEAKPEKEFVPRVFGFGVYFKTNYMYSDLIVPVNSDMDLVTARFLAGTSINLTFNAGMSKKVGFRFEPNVDFLTNSASTGSGSNLIKASTSLVEAGLKLLLVVRRGRVNIYPGLSGSYLFLGAKQIVGNTTTKVERNGGSIGVILGGEYLVTPHIGVRLESGLIYYNIGKANNGGNLTEDALGSFARLGGSFYF